MLKSLLFIISLLVTTATFSQKRIEKVLDTIKTEAQATSFLEKNSKKGKLITFNKQKHNTRLASDLFKLSKGGKKIYRTDTRKTYYKVIDKIEIPYHKVSYILLDGTKKTPKEINSLRNKIISKFNEGYRFEDLAKHYSIDENATRGGDLGWFTQGDMHPDFETPIIHGNFNVDDIFTIDVPESNSYYVVLKTEDTKLIEEIKVLKYTEPVK
ncbi:peptidylprolyl isomerase [Ichthyenterobacterium magnum]|uniref:Parvulin-like peptidyl-prolyl cis-trans isomerase protein n=1 Tax=Ichthyenterobacterium magnum TaxID=1230530 RepID=A0A420DMM7_9FLAO|nr:peptidylprolyl isomerase [Ichthyenterobacterium magnum]RKE95437.1 parvulin-like peptidyl-prolyl cis-trans isomerase protein [Ichthyenterobacterium magnum]